MKRLDFLSKNSALALLVFSAGCTAILGIDQDYEDVSGGTGASSSTKATTTSSGGATGSGGATSSSGGGTTSTGGATTSSSGGGTTSSGGGGSGGGVPCDPTGCPQPVPACMQATCVDMTCGTGPIAAGQPSRMQFPGDCSVVLCDGSGNAEAPTPDDTDLPDDGGDCHVGVCTGGVGTFSPLAAGTTCNTNGGSECDGNGNCGDCYKDAECAPLVCSMGECVSGNCADGSQDDAETDKDCGGGACPPCGPMQHCNDGLDCTSGICDSTQHCTTPSCSDGALNEGESDIDCGAVCNPPKLCRPDASCNVPGDCQTGICTGGRCAETCSDGILDNGESDKDCGGAQAPNCPRCLIDQLCNVTSDCAAPFQCSSGSCACPANMQFNSTTLVCECSTGFVDCDGNLANGCEAPAGGGALAISTMLSFTPSIAWSTQGYFGTVWYNGVTSNPDQQFVAVFQNGQELSSPVISENNMGAPVFGGGIAFNGNDFLIAYGRDTVKSAVVEVNKNGGVVNDTVLLSQSLSFRPAIATKGAASDTRAIAWSQFVGAGTATLELSVKPAGGSPVQGNVAIATGAQLRPSVAWGNSYVGVAYVSYQQAIELALMQPSNATLVTTYTLSTTTTTKPSISTAWALGKFAVTWEDNGSILFALVDEITGTFIGPYTVGAGHGPSVVAGEGGFRLVYGGSGMLNWARYTTAGTRTGAIVSVPTTANVNETSIAISNSVPPLYGVLYSGLVNTDEGIYYETLPSCAP